LAEADTWAVEWRSSQERVAPLFGRADQRKQARDDVRGLLGQVDRKDCWQLPEFSRTRSPTAM